MDCTMRMAMVTWYPGAGALSYTVVATAALGVSDTCEADSTTTTCDLEGLLCGQRYSVSVTAAGQTCSSVAHMAGQLVTGEPRHGRFDDAESPPAVQSCLNRLFQSRASRITSSPSTA